MDVVLPERFIASFKLDEAHLGQYLDAVGGGHPVHSSAAVARAAGFKGVPLPGVHVLGAALAEFTRRCAGIPIQLLDIQSRFLLPVYPGDRLGANLELERGSIRSTERYRAGRYSGFCTLENGLKALEIHVVLRFMAKNRMDK
ncbi:MaoC family dehydratase [Pollutimonas bauzanensis]|uniref:Acyl dehydratase n=1 Tax=Pollutimonas bauzanensis TaxID=658167 RepID=A0A1M5R540_9BURK|nr:MaoC family dehydratase [Pollutimonas bauzanensis]SHH21495.1 Acyl dehydratase [Pollutimonas bauzanensis]